VSKVSPGGTTEQLRRPSATYDETRLALPVLPRLDRGSEHARTAIAKSLDHQIAQSIRSLTPVPPRLLASLPCCLVALLPCCLVALLPRCLVASTSQSFSSDRNSRFLRPRQNELAGNFGSLGGMGKYGYPSHRLEIHKILDCNGLEQFAA